MTRQQVRSLVGTPDIIADSPIPTFSRRGRALIGQEMFRIFDRAKEMERQGHKIVHLELGNPSHRPPASVIEATKAALDAGEVGYTSPLGLPSLRQAIADWYARKAVPVTLDNVAISPANLLISQFLDIVCERDDTIALFSPAFPTYLAAARYQGLRVDEINLDGDTGYRLTRAAVDTAIAGLPRAILVNSANNPTGAVYDEATLRYLAQQCAAHGIWLLSDETYAGLCYGERFFSLSECHLDNIVVISSFSKIFAIPGFRIGYLVGSDAFVEKIGLSNSTLYSCLPIFSQQGCVAGLAQLDPYLETVRTTYAETVRESVARTASPTLASQPPQSAFYLFIDIAQSGLSDLEFCMRLLNEQHVAATPGRSFGSHFSHHIRIAVCGPRADVMIGIDRIAQLLESGSK